MDASEVNRRSYDAVASRWAEARAGFFARERAYLDALLAGAPPGSTVLDLGCGSGRPMADEVIARGYRVVGVDQSAALLAMARARHPGHEWVEAAIEDYRAAGPVQAVLLWDSLFHIERARHEAILRAAVAALAPGGRLMFTTGGSEHPAFTDTMFGETFHYDALPPAELRALLPKLGLRELVWEFMNEPDGARNKGRIAVVAEKAPAPRPHRDPLHGVTLEMIVTRLVEHYGWEALGERVSIRCFQIDPSVASSLKFLRRTPWARKKVEDLYLGTFAGSR